MLFKEINRLSPIAEALKKTKDLAERQEILLSDPNVRNALNSGELQQFLPASSDLSFKNALFALAAIGQTKHVLAYPKLSIPREKIRSLLQCLASIDRFYDSLGGIVGYHLSVLQQLTKKQQKIEERLFFPPPCVNLIEENSYAIAGLLALPEMGEVYPVGGLGSRLDLKNKKGESLPAACLSFCGRTLLEGLIRDVQAREFCYFRLCGKQITTPIALMASAEKQNAIKIKAICENRSWFGRSRESFFLFSQLSVPVVTEMGNWSMRAPLQLHLQPSGHGALWRTAEEKGVFLWFMEQDKKRLLIRQINNPIAGVDETLLALIGVGKEKNKCLGFASCERLNDALEGALVLMREEESQRISNIEYTEFCQSTIDSELHKASYPANTNILYVDLPKILPVIKRNPLPRLVLNMKDHVPYVDETGRLKEILGGRLESMMQNISDSLPAKAEEALETFLTHNKRIKTISATKKSFNNKKGLLETPEGAFYDQLLNAYELLSNECHLSLPHFSSAEEYLEKGPSLIFLYHPALGPLFQIIAQKIKGGRFAARSELQAEIADLVLENLNLEGSLLIHAHNLLGHFSQGIIRYSHQTGKCVLKNVNIKNKGIDISAPNCYWKNIIKRHEALKIILKGHSEFFAENVSLKGGQTFIVPEGERWIVTQNRAGGIEIAKEKPDWEWHYTLDGRVVSLCRS